VCYIENKMPAKKKLIPVRSSAREYSVVFGSGILRRAAREILALGSFSSIHVVSSPRVWRSAGNSVRRGLGRSNIRAVHLVNDDEATKNLRTVEHLARSLSRAAADRKCLIVAVGGGVVGDVVGFVSAAYLRGVALVHVPTTLVAQVDSALGGKTGVNLPEGKNLVGAFYPPRRVLADPDVLATLPPRQFRGGLAEVIKYGIIADPKLFAFLEENFAAVLRRSPSALEYIIPRCVDVKARVVSKDERESGLREILNFGHTFAHALESVTRYRRYQHGEAVAWGMMAAALLGHEAGLTPAEDVSRIVSLVRRLGPLPRWPRISPKALIAAMRADKKARSGKLRFILTPRIGKAHPYDDIPLDLVERVLHFAPQLATCSGTRNA
jgi:3-dehydroquinate synthase